MAHNDITLIHNLCDSLYQMLLSIAKNHPQWLKDKYRGYPWQSLDFQAKFKTKLKHKLAKIANQDQLLNQIVDLLNHLLTPVFFTSSYFLQLTTQIKSFQYLNFELNKHSHNYTLINQTSPFFALPMAILLLDIENLYIDIDSEKILAQVCLYPIKLKFAFANWRNLGKKDVEFYQRGYELLHVPPGKNSADLKMISFGSSIWLHHPNVKEVLICSSDGDLNHLSTTLQHHGINVYKVSRRSQKLVVFNSQTTETETFSLRQFSYVPDLDTCAEEIKAIIIKEQKRTQKTWIKLNRVKQIFKKQIKLNLEEIIAHHFPETTIREALEKNTEAIFFYQSKENAEVYMTIFSESEEIEYQNKSANQEINSTRELEQKILQIVKLLAQESNSIYIPISQVASQFQKQHGFSITKTMQKLQLGKKFTKLLSSYTSLELKQEKKIYYVKLKEL